MQFPFFSTGRKAADALVAKYRKTAFTTQDAKNAQAFKTAWLDFKVAAQDVERFLSGARSGIDEGDERPFSGRRRHPRERPLFHAPRRRNGCRGLLP